MDEGTLVDEIFKSLRWNGRYQITRSIVLLAALVSIIVHAMAVVFIGRVVTHECNPLHSLKFIIDNDTYDAIANTTFNVTYGACQVDVLNGSDVILSTTCENGYRYIEPRHSSFISEWDLVCEKESLADITQTVIVAGNLIGSLFLTGLADIYGRKKMFMLTNALFFVTALASSFMPSLASFLVMKFVSGAFVVTAGLFANVLSVELMPTEYRALPEQIIAYLWPTSLLFSCFIAYVGRDLGWRYIQLILTLLSAYVMVQWWITDESLRWLCVTKRLKEAEKLIKKIARINGVDPQKALDLLADAGKSQHCPEKYVINETSEKKSHNAIRFAKEKDQVVIDSETVQSDHMIHGQDDLQEDSLIMFARNRNLLKLTLVSCFLWFADSVTYDGLLLTSFSLADNFYLGFTLSVLTEFPAGIAFCVLINRIGRKRCINIFHLMAGVSLMVSNVLFYVPLAEDVPGKYWIGLPFALLGRFSIAVGFSSVYLYTPELFPTSVRNTGYGFSFVAALVGSMVAPHSRTLSRHYPWVPAVIFCVLCFMVPLVTPLLPETTGHELPQDVAEMDKWMDEYNKKIKKPQGIKV